MTTPPPQRIRAAFGASGEAVLLAGGQGRTWLVGDLVIKPVDHVVEHAWVSDVFADWCEPRVRVPEPLRAPDGSWSYDGWAAHRWVAGTTASMSTDAATIRSVSDAFHATVATLTPPAFIAGREDPWSYGDRVAWEGAAPLGPPPTLRQIDALRAVFAPVLAPAQVVHGDIGGNVLLEPGLAPAVIDWPPYTRPVGLALAVAVVDAICWEGVPLAFVDVWSDIAQWDQLLARALVYRIATAGVEQARGTTRLSEPAHAEATQPLVTLLADRLRRRCASSP